MHLMDTHNEINDSWEYCQNKQKSFTYIINYIKLEIWFQDV